MQANSSIQLHEGDLVAGKYRVERVLGVGGMGVVVAARHEQLDQLVAIKFVRDEVLGNDEAVERFLREARAAARLRSEHVARVLDVGRLESGAPYMVMEFLEGADLAQTLTRDGPMPFDLAARLILQVCEAVAEAHSAGIVHRDLKPENLFLTRTVGGTPRMKVLDFGVSKAAPLPGGGKGLLTGTRAMLGSPLYMAPEQMRSARDVDARIDVWALGVVLFELLTARSPFEADTLPELCLKVVNEPPVSLVKLRPDLPPEFVAVVDRCLEKDREKRYANAADLALALAPFAPPLSSFSQGRSSGLPSGLGAVPSFVPSSLAPVPSSLGPPSPAKPTVSSPAAWGAERPTQSFPAGPKQSRGAVWAWVGVVAVAVVVAWVAVRRGGGVVAPAATTPAPVNSTSALVPSVVATVAVSAAALVPQSLEPVPPAASASPEIAPNGSTVSPLGDAGAKAVAAGATAFPAPVYPQTPVRPTVSAPRGLDDDIPALR